VTARGAIPPRERQRLHEASSDVDTARSKLREAVVAAHRAGGSFRVIAAELGVSTNTIQNWIRAAAAPAHAIC
jgi:DNA-directed RNA polymerase specialized sigma24 family protein